MRFFCVPTTMTAEGWVIVTLVDSQRGYAVPMCLGSEALEDLETSRISRRATMDVELGKLRLSPSERREAEEALMAGFAEAVSVRACWDVLRS